MRLGLVLAGAVWGLGWAAGLAQARVVTGAVVDDVTGAPVGRALVTSADGRMAELTDAEGRFRVEMAAGGDGPVILSARRPGYLTMGRGVELRAGAETAELRLRPEAVVAGRVEMGEDRPARGAAVVLLERRVEDGRTQWAERASAQAGFDGSYRVAGLEPGVYRVGTREWAEGNDGGQGGVGDGSAPEVGYPPVQLPAMRVSVGQQVEADVLLRAARYYTVEMPVANCGGGPDSRGVGVGVQVRRVDGAEFALGYDGGAGAVKGSLPRGSYAVEVECFGREMRVGEVGLTVGDGPVRTAPVAIGVGGVVPVEVREEFSAAADAGGGVRRGGSGFAGRGLVAVRLQRVDGRPGEGDVGRLRGNGEGGSSLMGVGPGRYWVRIVPRQGYVAAATCGGVDLRREPLVVASGGGAQPVEVVLRNDTGEVRGRATGVGVTEVRLLPEGNEMESERDVPVGADGTFTASGVAPGRWLVLGSGAAGAVPIAYRDDAVERGWESRGAVAEVVAGGTATVSVAGVAVVEEVVQ